MHTKMLRSFCVGSFKLDVWTVYKQPGKATLWPHERITDYVCYRSSKTQVFPPWCVY